MTTDGDLSLLWHLSLACPAFRHLLQVSVLVVFGLAQHSTTMWLHFLHKKQRIERDVGFFALEFLPIELELGASPGPLDLYQELCPRGWKH